MFSKYSIKDLSGYHKGLYCIKWNKDGEYLAAVSGDRSVRICQFNPTSSNAEIVHTIPTPATMHQVCWHPQENMRLALCNDDKPVELWDIRASKAAMKIQTLGGNINMDWSPCGNYLAVGNKSDYVVVVDVRTGNQLKKKKFHYEVNELAWSYNSDYILSAANPDGYGSVDLISFKSEEELEVVETIAAHSSNCFICRVDPTFQRFALGSSDQCISLWNLETMISSHTITLDNDIRHFAFSGDGKYLAVVADETNLLICDCENGNGLARINTKVRNQMVAWHPLSSQVLAVMHESRSTSSQYLKLLLFKD